METKCVKYRDKPLQYQYCEERGKRWLHDNIQVEIFMFSMFAMLANKFHETMHLEIELNYIFQ